MGAVGYNDNGKVRWDNCTIRQGELEMTLRDLEKQFDDKVDEGQSFLRKNAWWLIGGVVVVVAALIFISYF